MTTTHSTATVPNPDAIEALALAIMRSETDDIDYNGDEDAASLAHGLVYYSDKARLYIKNDRKRFPGVSGLDADELDDIGDNWSFYLGFNFALQLGARIAAAPLAEIGASDLVSIASAGHFERLERVHDEHFRKGHYTRPPEHANALADA